MRQNNRVHTLQPVYRITRPGVKEVDILMVQLDLLEVLTKMKL